MNLHTTTLDLIRHGEPEGGRKFRGSTDDPLSQNGWQQMTKAVSSVSGWDAVVTSPMIRCRAFAQQMAEKLDLPLYLEPDLREICFGQWEGHTSDEVSRLFPGELTRFWADPENNTPTGGETIRGFHNRVSNAWDGILERHEGKHVLMVAHGGTIRALIKEVLQIPFQTMWRLEVEFASLSRIRVYDNEGSQTPVLISHGLNHPSR